MLVGENVKEKINPSKKRNRFVLFFLISLIIHAILVIILMFHAFEKRPTFVIIPLKNNNLKKLQKLTQQKKEKELKEKKKELPASLKPRKSVFGSTVFFDDNAQFTPPQAKIIGPQDQQGLDLDKPVLQKVKNEKSQLQTKKGSTQKSNIENKKISLKPKSHEPLLDTKAIKIDSIKTSLINEKKEETEAPNNFESAKKITLDNKISMESSEHPYPPAKIQKFKMFGEDAQDKSPISRKEKKSIISMTKGYIENLKDKGIDWIERKGDDNKRPSLLDYKDIIYQEKIIWHIQAAFKTHTHPVLTNPKVSTLVGFLITKDGFIHGIKLLKPSDNQQIDQMILKIIELASPFPPLPKHFPDNYHVSIEFLPPDKDSKF